MKIVEYLELSGRSPFQKWFEALDARAAAKMTVALTRIGQGNLSNAKSVGEGVLELRIDFGPGYRIYFGREGEEVVILLAGGTKRRQQDDIKRALQRWQDHKKRKRNN
jgi:putative addiction module killer protein